MKFVDTGDGIDDNGGSPQTVKKDYIYVTWGWNSNYTAPLNFEIAIFTGTDPTASSNYIVPIQKALPTDRALQVNVPIKTQLTGLNSAVRAIYGGTTLPSPWVSTVINAVSSAPAVTPLGTAAGVTSAQGAANTANAVIAQQNSASYMTNLDKINFVAQWVAEANIQTALDAQAVASGVSHTAYDNAVSNVSTGLITAGAPSNWASIWPDGTTSGPWTNVMLTINSLWAAVATQRAGLQASISSAGAAAAQAAAISAAATDATTKMNSAIVLVPANVTSLPTLPSASYPAGKLVMLTTNSQLYQVNTAGTSWVSPTVAASQITGTLAAAQVASLAASQITGQLSSAQIAAVNAAAVSGQLTASQIASVNAASVGSGLTSAQISSVAATALTGTLVDAQIASGISASKLSGTLSGASVPTSQLTGYVQAAQIQANSIGANQIAANAIVAGSLTLTNWENLIPNPNSNGLNNGVAWPAGSYEGAGLTSGFGNNLSYFNPPNNGYFRVVTGNTSSNTALYIGPPIPCKPGDTFQFSGNIYHLSGLARSSLQFQVLDATGAVGAWPGSGAYQSGKANVTYTCPNDLGSGQPPATIQPFLNVFAGSGSDQRGLFNFFQMKRMADASLIVDGSIVASKIAANSVTAAAIAAGTITSAQIAAGTIQASNIAAGTITAAQLAAGSVTATQIAASSITGTMIQANTIQAASLIANSITASQIAAGTLTATQIQAGSISGACIAAGTIQAGNIAAGTITASQIAAGAITATQLAAGAVTATSIAAGSIGAAQIAAGAICANSLTISNFDNLVPNPTSALTNPNGQAWPSGSYEATCLTTGWGTNAAYFNPPASGGTRGLLGPTSGGANACVTPPIPCSPGDVFTASCNAWNGSGNATAVIGLLWGNPSGQSACAYSNSVTSGVCSVTATAPADMGGGNPCTFVQLLIGTMGSATGWNMSAFNYFYMRRCVDAKVIVDGSITTTKLVANAVMTSNFATDTGQTAASLGNTGIPSGNPTAGAWFGVGSANPILVGPGGMKVGVPVYGGSYVSYKVDAPAVMSFNALRTNYTTSAPPQYPRFWYGGNCDSTSLGGAPNINRLTLNVTYWDTTNHMAWMDMVLAPSVAADNLDSMRYATIQFYRQSAAGTSGTLTPFPAVFKVALKDRLYQDPASDGDGVNSITTTVPFVNSGISSGYLACIVTLYNAFGPSASNCFYTPAGWTAGGSLINNGTSFPSGLSGRGSGGSGGGGGGGGLGCVPAGTLLLMADGTWLPIEQAEIDMEVAAWDDQTLQPVPARIARTFVFKDRSLWRIVTADGELVCSHDHRILQGAAWVPAREALVGVPTLWRLATGKLVYSTILEAAPTGETATVYHVGLDQGHVYCAGNLLAHNMKAPN